MGLLSNIAGAVTGGAKTVLDKGTQAVTKTVTPVINDAKQAANIVTTSAPVVNAQKTAEQLAQDVKTYADKDAQKSAELWSATLTDEQKAKAAGMSGYEQLGYMAGQGATNVTSAGLFWARPILGDKVVDDAASLNVMGWQAAGKAADLAGLKPGEKLGAKPGAGAPSTRTNWNAAAKPAPDMSAERAAQAIGGGASNVARGAPVQVPRWPGLFPWLASLVRGRK